MKYLLIGLWAALTGLCFWGWNTAQNTCCGAVPPVPQTSVTTPKVTPTNIIKQAGPLVFNWASGATITSSSFPAYRDSILGLLGKEDKLEIVGLYTNNEENTSSFENMGLARANETKKLFSKFLSTDRMVLKAKVQNVATKDKAFEAIHFRPLRNSKAIVEMDDEVVIYFPLNSSSKLNSKEIEDYLDKVADKIKASGEKVQLTGHTCDRGDERRNMRLGKKRANIIADYLVKKGVPNANIIRQSKGETAPMVPNTSEENRVKNRRTVLKILKKH